MSDSLQPHGLQHARLPCPSPTPRACSNSCPSRRWCHPTISSSVIPFSPCLQSFPASGSFQMSQLFASGGQRIGVSASASVLAMNIQDWFPLGWTGWISLRSRGLWRVLSNTTVQKHQFFHAQLYRNLSILFILFHCFGFVLSSLHSVSLGNHLFSLSLVLVSSLFLAFPCFIDQFLWLWLSGINLKKKA